MTIRIIGIIVLIASTALYYFDIVNFPYSDFILGVLSAIGAGLALGFFNKKK